MDLVLLVVIELVALTGLDGRIAYVNPAAVVQLYEPRDEQHESRQIAKGVNCIVALSGTRYVSVRETCAEIRKLFTAADGKPR